MRPKGTRAAHRESLRAAQVGALLGLAFLSCSGACSPVYPELSAPLAPPPAGKPLKPPPPASLMYVAFKSVTIPALTRDGRPWRSDQGSKPDPFAELLVNGKTVLRTPVQSSTLHPTWPDQRKGNYVIPEGALVQVQVWDSRTLTDHPICIKTLHHLRAEVDNGQVDVSCDSGAHVVLTAEPAHARFGLGFWYQLRTRSAYITRVGRYSPAGRIELRAGDRILKIQGKPVSAMRADEVKSLINANAETGVDLTIRRAHGSVEDVTLQDGPIYPLPGEGMSLK